MEKPADRNSLPPAGFTTGRFPMKLKGGSAGFTRAVAICEE